MDAWVIVVIVLVVLALVGVGIWFYLRQRWISSLNKKGWVFEGSPDLWEVHGLNCPPFGLGNKRWVSDLIAGELPSGTKFRSVLYKTDTDDRQIIRMLLPRPLPELHVASQPVPGALAPVLEGFPYAVQADDPAYARAMVPPLLPAVDRLAALGPVRLSVDGASLVSSTAPREADALEAHVLALDEVYRALCAQPFDPWPEPPVPPELSVYRHPDWIYRDRDDAALDRVIHDRGGEDHRATEVHMGEMAGFAWVALQHHWVTTRTETDSEGRTRTVRDHHDEWIMELTAPNGFPDFSVNKFSLFRKKSQFESIEFNRDFSVRCKDPRFAHDVVHPRQMEYVQATRPRGFEIEHGRFRLDHDGSVRCIEQNLDFAYGFLARIPSFVWANLGYAEPPLSLTEG